MAVSSTFLICAPAINDQVRFIAEPDETCFLRVPARVKSYSPQGLVSQARWKKAVIAAADGPRTKSPASPAPRAGRRTSRAKRSMSIARNTSPPRTPPVPFLAAPSTISGTSATMPSPSPSTWKGRWIRNVMPTRRSEYGRMVLVGGKIRPEYQPGRDEARAVPGGRRQEPRSSLF